MNGRHEGHRIKSFKEFTMDLSLWMLQSNKFLNYPTDIRIAV